MIKVMEKRIFDVEKMSLGAMDLDAFVLGGLNRDNIKMTFLGGGQGGGKIAAEFNRLGYPAILYNTCKEDLDDIFDVIGDMRFRGEVQRIDLPGEGGASKDRDLGFAAIKDNLELLDTSLGQNKNLIDSDFVWICVTLGGGTGNGSLRFVTEIVNYIRSGEGKNIVRAGVEKPTVGVIAALPSKDAKSRIAVNAAKAIAEMEELHKENSLGAVILVDNQKMMDDFKRDYENKTTNKTWAVDGNTKVARIVTELALMTNLSGSEVLDKSEMLDIWATPGFLSIGKQNISNKWLERIEVIEGKPLTSERKEEVFEELVKNSFKNGIFVEGVAPETAIHGGLAIIGDGEVISTKDSKMLEVVMNQKILISDAVEAPHYGFFNTDYLGTVKSKKNLNLDVDEPCSEDEIDNTDGRVFAMCVTHRPPQQVMDWCKKAIESRKKYEKCMDNINKDNSLSSMLGDLNSTSKLKDRSENKTGIDRLLSRETVTNKKEGTRMSLADRFSRKSTSDGSKESEKDQLLKEFKK